MKTVNIAQKFAAISDYWNPRVAGEVNDSAIKLVKFTGEFVWHHHDHEDELFLIVKGTMRMLYREAGAERELRVGEGEFVIVPHGVEHKPVADEEVWCVLVEPNTTLNTGNVQNERTRAKLETI